MDKSKLYSLLKQNEGPKLDFKEELDISCESGKKEIAKDIIAIANSQGGRGYLVIGIEDKTKVIKGIGDKEYREESIQQLLSLRCDPPLIVRVEKVNIESKVVCVIIIFRSFQKPHQMMQTGAFYLRRGSTTDVARREEIASMLQYNGIINNERTPLFNMSLDVYDKNLIGEYLDKINLSNQEDNYSLLNNLGIIHYDRDSDMYVPTLGGVLIFSKNPQMFLPYTGIRIINRFSSEKTAVFIKGNIFDMIDKVVQYFIDLDIDYPINAIKEAVINAIIHRDYFDISRDILINVGKRKIVVSNPGSTFGKERLNNLIRSNNPRRRNNWLYNTFLIIDSGKDTGRGLLFIKSSFKERVQFINVRKTNIFKVVMPGMNNFNKTKSKK